MTMIAPGQQRAPRYIKLAVPALLVVFAVQAMLSMRNKSVTVDELMYIAAGYYHLRTGDFSMNMTNPSLMKLVSALPLLTLDLRLPEISSNPADWSIIEQWQYARVFLYENTRDADTILFLARLPIVGVALVLGFYVFIWSRQLYGPLAALLALTMFAFSPNLLAHARLATLDLGLTALMLICSYYFWQYMRAPAAGRLVLCGVLLGLALLAKTTAFFLIPAFAIYGLHAVLSRNGRGLYERLPFVRRRDGISGRTRHVVSLSWSALIIAGVSLLTLNAGYFFQDTFQPISSDRSHETIYQRLPVDNALMRSVVDAALETPLPLPQPFIAVLRSQFSITNRQDIVFFAGETSRTGWWWLMIVSYVLKTPIPALLLLTLTLFTLVNRRNDAEWLLVAVIGIVVFVFSYVSSINVGLRYILPIIPFVHILVSRLLALGWARRRTPAVVLSALMLWYIIGTVRVYPHYLAYFNEAIGGPSNGHKYLVDSNLDWGQDLKGLKHYMDRHGISKIQLAYFGSADARHYGIDYDYLPSVGLAPNQAGQRWWFEYSADNPAQPEIRPGLLAASATLLRGRFLPGVYQWLWEYEPIDQVGHSILIYDIPKEATTHGPGANHASS